MAITLSHINGTSVSVNSEVDVIHNSEVVGYLKVNSLSSAANAVTFNPTVSVGANVTYYYTYTITDGEYFASTTNSILVTPCCADTVTMSMNCIADFCPVLSETPAVTMSHSHDKNSGQWIITSSASALVNAILSFTGLTLGDLTRTHRIIRTSDNQVLASISATNINSSIGTITTQVSYEFFVSFDYNGHNITYATTPVTINKPEQGTSSGSITLEPLCTDNTAGSGLICFEAEAVVSGNTPIESTVIEYDLLKGDGWETFAGNQVCTDDFQAEDGLMARVTVTFEGEVCDPIEACYKLTDFVDCEDYVWGVCDPANVAPVGVNDSPSTSCATPVVIDLLANDTDADNDDLHVTAFTQPSNGVVVENTDGTVTYTPNGGFSGTDSFSYTLTDGQATDTATATVTVGNCCAIAITSITNEGCESGEVTDLTIYFTAVDTTANSVDAYIGGVLQGTFSLSLGNGGAGIELMDVDISGGDLSVELKDSGDSACTSGVVTHVVPVCPTVTLHSLSITACSTSSAASNDIRTLSVNTTFANLTNNGTQVEVLVGGVSQGSFTPNGSNIIGLELDGNGWCGQILSVVVRDPAATSFSDSSSVFVSDCCALELESVDVGECQSNGDVDLTIGYKVHCANSVRVQLTEVGGSATILSPAYGLATNPIVWTVAGNGKSYDVKLVESPAYADKCESDDSVQITLPTCCIACTDDITSSIAKVAATSGCNGTIDIDFTASSLNCNTPLSLKDLFVDFSEVLYQNGSATGNTLSGCASPSVVTTSTSSAGSNSTLSIACSGLKNGSYYFTVQDGNGCEKSVTVNLS